MAKESGLLHKVLQSVEAHLQEAITQTVWASKIHKSDG